MALVIRNATLMTMTERGTIRGDMLISGGCILKIAEKLNDLEGFEHEELDAAGLTVTPGLIDLHIRDGGAEPAWVSEMALEAGVTTAVLLPECGDRCTLLGSGALKTKICHVIPENLTDNHLAETLHRNEEEGMKQLCRISDERQLQRVLEIAGGVAGIILAELCGCEESCDKIAESGFGAVVGVNRYVGRGPWEMVHRLTEAGVPTALSSCYPATKLKLLPVCAGLCVREGRDSSCALQSITSAPAALLGLQDRGHLREGSRADLIIYDGDPLLLATSRLMTIADGFVHRRRHD